MVLSVRYTKINSKWYATCPGLNLVTRPSYSKSEARESMRHMLADKLDNLETNIDVSKFSEELDHFCVHTLTVGVCDETV